VERNLVPDSVLRIGIQREIEMELVKIKMLSAEQRMAKKQDFIRQLKAMPIAIATKEANDQHYEVPDEFFQMVLGPCLKYSCCWYATSQSTLAEAEIAMLEMYCERAGLVDGMNIIDLGCGWGSVTLFLANKYPNSTIRSISNSNSQREYIMFMAEKRGFKNVYVFTGDISTFDLSQEEYYSWADRVISIEMFEHMKNYQLLMKKVSNWLKPGGKLFVHIFVSLELPGHYESGWMTDNFFTGGTLPSDDLLLYFQDDLRIENHWRVNGKHYQRTLEDWLVIMDGKKQATLDIMGRTYGAAEAMKRYVYWRLFFMGCAEFFGARNGEEYFVSHYLFVKP
jgi:cyclopropane-fatty-acyl-phospholipid synthase